MSNETKFIDGLIVKAPNDNAPSYVKAKLSIRREELIATLQGMEGDWINAEIKVSSGGKWYCAIDEWKPNADGGSRQSAQPQRQAPQRRAPPPPADDFNDDPDIPF